MKPFFSIIIPVYNVAPYLRECLDSVLAQTFTDWECLCVNDGSTDESGAILDEYAQKDPRFRVFHKKNSGVSAARNLGLDNVRGEWVLFLDSDDLLANTCLGAIVEHLTDEIDWLSFNAQTMDARGTIIDECRPRKVWTLSREDFSKCSIDLNVVWGNCFRRAWLDECQLRFDTELSVAEDSLFMSLGLIHTQKMKHLGDVAGYFYRLPEGRGSLMERASKKYTRCRFEAFNVLMKWLTEGDDVVLSVVSQWGQMIYGIALKQSRESYGYLQRISSKEMQILIKNVQLVNKVRFLYLRLAQKMWVPYWLWKLFGCTIHVFHMIVFQIRK
jgi:glycosyltransferase involved in cell wall biosynthesis